VKGNTSAIKNTFQ